MSHEVEQNPFVKRGREIALRVARVVESSPLVTGIFVFGSVAQGHADQRSDVDLAVVCDPEVPSIGLRLNFLQSVGTDWRIDHQLGSGRNGAIWDSYDKGAVDGVDVELHYMSASKVARVLDQVIHHGAVTTNEVAFRPYRIGAVLLKAWTVMDRDGLIARWRSRLSIHPGSG